MRKKERNRNIIIGVILVVGLIFILSATGNLKLFASVPYDLDQYVGNCVGGWTTLSTSDVSIVGEGDRIRVFGVAKGSECLAIRLTESGLDSKLNAQGYDATQDVIGNIRLLKYSKTFPVDRIGEYKGNLNNKVITGTLLKYATIQNCVNAGYPTTIYAYKPIGGITNIRCVIPGQQGIAGDFSAARSYGNFDILFELGGYSAHLTREQQSVSVGNHRITWEGSLLNLDQIYPPQYDARLIESKWDLVSDGALNSIEIQINSFIYCMKNKPSGATPDSHFDYCDGIFDSRTSILLQSRTSEYLSRVSTLVYDVSTDNNALYVSLKAAPYPAFILDLDAEAVGIVRLEGKPEITNCIPDQELDSGKNKVVSFSVFNDANVDNVEFSASIQCNEGVLGFIPNFYMGKYQEKTINAELIPSNPDPDTLFTSCKLEVRDISSGNTDSCWFDAEVEYEAGIICTPGTLSCSEDFSSIMKCTSDGKGKTIIEECEIICIQDDEGVRCGDKDDEICPPIVILKATPPLIKNDITIPDFICHIKLFFKNLFAGVLSFFTILKWILVVVAFIFSLLFGRDLFDSFKVTREKKWLAWLFSFIIAGFVAYITIKLWWLGLIALVVYILFRLLIGGKLLAIKKGVRALRK